MRIAYFTESLPPNTDGVSHTLVRLSEYLLSREIEFRFVSPFKPSDGHYLRQKVRQVRSIPFPMYSAYKMGIPYFHGLPSYLDDFQPDLVHVVSPTLLCRYGIKYARDRAVPVVGSYHTHFVSYFKYYGFGRFETLGWKYLRWFYNQCDITYVPSEKVRDELQFQGIRNVSFLPHGIDTDQFSPEYRSEDLRTRMNADEEPILLFVGRLVREKDLADLIEVDRILRSRGYQFQMVFVGDGPMRKELQEKLPRAHFTGTLEGEALSRWYASADVFLFPSTTETFGLVVQEAFASGIPVVGVRAGGVISLIEDGVNGYLAEPNDVEDIAEKTGRLLSDSALCHRLGVRARRQTEDRSWNKINQQLVDEYRLIITPEESQEDPATKASSPFTVRQSEL